MASRLSNKRKIKSLITVTTSGIALSGGLLLYQGNEKFFNQVVMPVTRLLDPEVAHNFGIKAAKWGLLPTQKIQDPVSLKTTLWGLQFDNPLGMAAGFDKQGEAIPGLQKMGFSFVEIGSVTPQPQLGNPKPRVFRLLEDTAVINRYGFNSDGHEVVYNRLKEVKEDPNFEGIVGVNLGKNKLSEDAAFDYMEGLRKFSDLADYFVVNISSPNTPGLRNLQNKNNLHNLLLKLNETRETLKKQTPLLLKLAPDLTEEERQNIAEVVLNKKTQVDGLIISNTTIDRSHLKSVNRDEIGGLSGKPLTQTSTEMIADMFQRTKGKVPIIGVGGIFSGSDAYEKIKAGASLVQIYTSFIYHGPPIVGKIKDELNKLLLQDGYSSLSEAVGKNSNSSTK
ncbi:dihydroorotate dehydrogenase (quinone), mitochondrial [Leptopilina heterotoma]|uniref:dihydroorotate dehydrogenase (quinone), mitochondrial n=1 Tax=Leptopilina heterotoma TaxID=63436 RepID=UPI001CA9BE16|nr:dihydroorotate dehydrogenase (quinone), mitochondrial [Leptopilina heterotoma]XP_043469281.1 dihydroorotate dehydrogenase (quinone), mitochondrial [Leptopilina heterotoma]